MPCDHRRLLVRSPVATTRYRACSKRQHRGPANARSAHSGLVHVNGQN